MGMGIDRVEVSFVEPLPKPPPHEHMYRLQVSYDNMGFQTTGTHDECMEWLRNMFARMFLPDVGATWMNPMHVFRVDHMSCIHNDCPAYKR